MPLSLIGFGPLLTVRENEANEGIPRLDSDVGVILRNAALSHRVTVSPGIGFQDIVVPGEDAARGLTVTARDILRDGIFIASWNYDDDVSGGTQIDFAPGTGASVIEAVIEALRYRQILDTPAEFRALTLTLTEIAPGGTPGESTSATTQLRVIAENDAPEFTADSTWQAAEGSDGATAFPLVEDPDGDALALSLEGPDAALLRVSGNRVTFLAPPDFEAPRDADRDNRYQFTLVADDGTVVVRKDFTIIVTNVPETPSLTGLPPVVAFGENAVNALPRPLFTGAVFTEGDALGGSQLLIGGLLDEDRVSIADTGGITLDVASGEVGFAGAVIGTAEVGLDRTLSVTLTTQADGAAVQALLRALRYANTSDTPTLLRSVTIELLGPGGPLGPLSVPLAVTPENDLPIGPVQRALAPWSGGPPAAISPAMLLQGWTDADGDALAITDITLVTPRGSLAAPGPLGVRLYTPEAGDATEAVFRYTVSDGQAAVTALATLDLLPVNVPPTGALALSAQGGLLLADASAIRDADGLGPIAITWEREVPGTPGWEVIAGAGGPAFAAPNAPLPTLYRAVASFIDGEGTAERLVSEAALVGGGRGEALTAAAGVPLLDGRGGNDTLTGTGGNETLRGGAGEDRLAAAGGDDTLEGQAGNDRLDGGAGDDRLAGGLGDDTMTGDAGEDLIEGWLGTDMLTGGAGADLFFYANRGSGGDVVTDFTPGEDLFAFAAQPFGSLAPGALDPARFALDAPTLRGAQFVFHSGSGTLYFDVDGIGARPGLAIATLTNGAVLGARDISILG